jgi:membrane fusion protein, multidrug efflux system
MRMKLVVIVAALITVGGVALAGEHLRAATETGQPAVPPPAVPVVAGTVHQGDVPIYLRGVGTVIAYNNVIVRSQITGQIVKIAFKQGQTVGSRPDIGHAAADYGRCLCGKHFGAEDLAAFRG